MVVIFRYRELKAAILLFVLTPFSGRAQSPFSDLKHLFTEPKSYVTRFTSDTPAIDGDLTDTAWQNAAWTDLFTDIEGAEKPAPAHSTRVKMLWDNSFLYVAAELQEPHVWGKLRHHDEVVFYDNDFEVFIDPDNNTHHYFEIEVNALNTIFDLFLSKPYRNYGSALISWDTPGLRSAIKVNGTLNISSDTDTGWTVEMAIPFRALALGNHVKIPKEGDLWRINFSRVQWDTDIKNGDYIKRKGPGGKNLPEHNWVWSPQGVINMHYPERWGYLQFTMNTDRRDLPVFQLPYAERQKNYLWLVYYRQKEFHRQNGSYASSLSQLGIDPDITIGDKINKLQLEGSRHQFYATIQLPEGQQLTIDHEGLVRP